MYFFLLALAPFGAFVAGEGGVSSDTRYELDRLKDSVKNAVMELPVRMR